MGIAQRNPGDAPDHERHDGHVVYVTGLVTFVESDDAVPDPREMSVSARHEGVLDNGDRVLLLDDRGWSTSGPATIWAVTSVEDIADTARMVVGPDGPFGGRSQKDMEADHWPPLLRPFGIRASTWMPWSWRGYRTMSSSARSC